MVWTGKHSVMIPLDNLQAICRQLPTENVSQWYFGMPEVVDRKR
jgi:hypothetical protein